MMYNTLDTTDLHMQSHAKKIKEKHTQTEIWEEKQIRSNNERK